VGVMVGVTAGGIVGGIITVGKILVRVGGGVVETRVAFGVPAGGGAMIVINPVDTGGGVFVTRGVAGGVKKIMVIGGGGNGGVTVARGRVANAVLIGGGVPGGVGNTMTVMTNIGIVGV